MEILTPEKAVAVTPMTSLDDIDQLFADPNVFDMRLLMMALWKNRQNRSFTTALCEKLSYLSISKPTLDQLEFYLPQLAHMVVHFDKELPIEAMEQFVLLLSQSSVHFALQLFWMIYAALDENRPKRNGSPRTFARCAQLLLALEQCFVYGTPVAREASELLTRNSISKAEMEQIVMADRRFFAAQSSIESKSSDVGADSTAFEGWLFKKGGGTRKMGRRNWKLRWCRIEKRILLIFTRPHDKEARSAVPLDRADVQLVENPKHPFYFELNHEFSETKFKFAAQSQEELMQWISHLQKAAAAPEPPSATTPGKASPPAKTIARMSFAMRSFILQSSTGTKAEETNEVEAEAEGIRRARSLSSVSSVASVQSDDGNEEVHGDPETLLSQSQYQTPLPMDQQRRYEFFSGLINFVKAITDVSETLRRVEPPKRKPLLRPRLEQLKIPAKAYIPLCKSTDSYCNVVAVYTSEGRVFSTNERAPCLIYFATEEDPDGDDVSRALFRHLYESFEPNEETPREKPATIGSGTSMSPFLREVLADQQRKEKLEKIFGELSFSTAERLQKTSPTTDPSRWRLVTLIAKSFDDLRQEVLVMQLISYFQHIFALENLPLWLHPYRILSTGASTGLIEVVQNAMSLDGIKKTPGFKNLRQHLESVYGPAEANEGDGAELLRQAELNFVHSLAAYSIVCYILSIKDRHNGNILLDIEGHIVHIDFGFFLGRAPGGSFSFETAPFKLTTEMVDALGGRQSSNFKYFCDLCVRGALAARKHADTIYTLVEVMSFHSRLPCFANGMATSALSGLRERLFLNMPEEKVAPTILQMIERSYDHFGTNKYDQFQVYSNGIAK